VIALSENIKFENDLPSGDSHQGKSDTLTGNPQLAEAAQTDQAESQMRKALGLLGETPRHRPDHERTEQGRGSDRFNGGLHRRRFVQDGDVPVTVLRREPGHEAPPHRSSAATVATASNRLQRIEAALATETAARERAERLLAEAQTAVRDLQTKIGHAELARNEAVDALRRERESFEDLRAEAEARDLRVQGADARANTAEAAAKEQQAMLADERHARKAVEKMLRAVEATRDAAEQLVQTMSEEAPQMPRVEFPNRRRAAADVEPVISTPRRGRSVGAVEQEPEPVKWWLNTKPSIKRR